MAEVSRIDEKTEEPEQELKKVETVNQRTIAEVSNFLNVQPERTVSNPLYLKWMMKLVMILVRGDHEVNDIKVKKALNAKTVELAEHMETEDFLGCPVGHLDQ